MTEVLTVDGARRVRVVDSHTGGEPTRVVTDGFPDLEGATLAERAADMAGRHRRLATAIVDEPRGNEAMVGALLTPPTDPACVAGVIYFDRTMVLGMCGHGTIGVVETLARLGRIGPGEHAIETPVGVVRTVLGDDGRVTIDNVVSRRTAHDVRVDVPGIGAVAGDVAYGGNVFFLVTSPAIDLSLPRADLLRIADDIRRAVHDGRTSRRRPRRALRPAARRGCELAQLRAVPERHLRPLAVRHRHQRQGGGTGRRRRAGRGRDLGAGVDHRLDLRDHLPLARPRRRRRSCRRSPAPPWSPARPSC